MINLATAESIFILTLLIIAYFISITINGYIQTWVASKMGDDTAEELGYLSLNPLVHLDIISLVALVLFYLGWPKTIPVNPLNITGKNRLLKLLLIYSTETIVSLLIAFSALFLSISLFNPGAIFTLVGLMFIFRDSILTQANTILPNYNSFGIVIALLLIAIVFLNIFIAALSFILNGFKYVLLLGFEKGYKYIEYADYLYFFGPFIVILFFADPIRYLFLKAIMWAVCKMSYL